MLRLSAIVPVYNNQETLARVLAVLLHHPAIAEVVAVDDGSADASPRILAKTKGVRVVTHKINQGKGAGIVSGWKAARLNTLLTVDADLARLTAEHLDTLISEFLADSLDMVVGARENPYVFGWVSGERIYKKDNVMPYAELATGVGNGIEQVINFAHRGKRTKLIILKNVGHILKLQRHAPQRAAWLYLREGWQLAKTEYRLRFRTKFPLPVTKQEN